MLTPQQERDIKISAILQDLLETHNSHQVHFGELVQSLHQRGFGFLMIVFALPNCVPVPIPPGVSTIFSIPLLFLSTQMVLRMDYPWFPEWLRNKVVRRRTLVFMIESLLPKLRWLEKFIRARITFAKSKTRGEQILGVICLVFAISIAVPLPMTNFLPGVGILLISIGLITRDGLVMLAGISVGIIGILVTSTILYLGYEGFNLLLEEVF